MLFGFGLADLVGNDARGGVTQHQRRARIPQREGVDPAVGGREPHVPRRFGVVHGGGRPAAGQIGGVPGQAPRAPGRWWISSQAAQFGQRALFAVTLGL
ncbi:MAG: hypothetical protein ACRDQY_00790 [Pseudonocardiaceae bacterium]